MKKWERMNFGDEKRDEAQSAQRFTSCPKCHTGKGEYHRGRCVIEECVACGGDWIDCAGFHGCQKCQRVIE